MKETYQTPDIMFEDFSLSASIADDCDTLVRNQSRDTGCAYITRTGLNVFTSKVSGCTTIEDDGDYNGICYHVPIETANLFNS